MRKLLSILISLLVVVCVFTMNVSANTHNHCVCGKTSCEESGHDVSQVWSSASTLPTESGYYYLTSDINLAGTPWNVLADKDIHLCLNGHQITTEGYIGDYLINVYGKLTITDCKDEGSQGSIISNRANGIFNVSGSGLLEIYNGNLVHNSHGKNSVNAASGGKVNIYGGSFSNQAHPAKNLNTIYGFLVSVGTNSQINVFNGNFVVSTITNALDSSEFTPFLLNSDGVGTINISGGYFKAKYYGYSTYSFATTTITGGIFDSKTSSHIAGTEDIDLTKKISTSYEIVELTSGGYQVKKIEAFQIGTNTYVTLKEALQQANDNDVIVVLRDGQLKDVYAIDKIVVIDLNGFVLEGKTTTSEVIKVVENGNLTLKDSSNAKTGKLYAYNASPTLLRVSGGTLTINSGNYQIQVDSYVSYSHVIDCKNGTVTINGGTFSILKGCDTSGDNLYSSLIAATKLDATKDSIINVKNGTFNCSYSTTQTGIFASRIFTPYKGTNADFGTINIVGGNFNGDYNNPELTEIQSYIHISGGTFDKNTFTNDVKLSDMINTTKYRVKSTKDSRYTIVLKRNISGTGVDYNCSTLKIVSLISLFAMATYIVNKKRK